METPRLSTLELDFSLPQTPTSLLLSNQPLQLLPLFLRHQFSKLLSRQEIMIRVLKPRYNRLLHISPSYPHTIIHMYKR
jgi:hypothetical protein